MIEEIKTSATMARTAPLFVAGVICAALAVVGITFWSVQLTGGMVQTGMRNLNSWGLYITLFMFFVGLSAGGLIISSMPKALGIEGVFGNISKIAVWVAICCTVGAVGFVVVDLGNPMRLWELFVFSNLQSPLMWDIVVISTYLILSIALFWAMYGEERGKVGHKALRILSGISLVTAVLVHSVTAWIFGLQAGREFWHTALLAPWFVSSALVCGTALIIVVVIALRKAARIELDQSYVGKMAKFLGGCICIDLYFFGCDLLTSGYPAGEGLRVVQMLVVGPLAPFFWIEIVGCIVAAVICFTPALRTNLLLVAASMLAIVGIFCKRVQLLIGGFQNANLDLTTPLAGYGATPNAFSGLIYWPTGIEFAVALGVLGLVGSLLCFGLNRITGKE